MIFAYLLLLYYSNYYCYYNNYFYWLFHKLFKSTYSWRIFYIDLLLCYVDWKRQIKQHVPHFHALARNSVTRVVLIIRHDKTLLTKIAIIHTCNVITVADLLALAAWTVVSLWMAFLSLQANFMLYSWWKMKLLIFTIVVEINNLQLAGMHKTIIKKFVCWLVLILWLRIEQNVLLVFISYCCWNVKVSVCCITCVVITLIYSLTYCM